MPDLEAAGLDTETLEKIGQVDHYWYEFRSAGTGAIASTGYRLVAAALAEQTNGIIASWDGAFDKHNVETAEEFLQWWGDEQIARYGLEALLIDCAVELVNPHPRVIHGLGTHLNRLRKHPHGGVDSGRRLAHRRANLSGGVSCRLANRPHAVDNTLRTSHQFPGRIHEGSVRIQVVCGLPQALPQCLNATINQLERLVIPLIGERSRERAQ